MNWTGTERRGGADAHDPKKDSPFLRMAGSQRPPGSIGDPDLVTVAVDLDVKQLAVITVRQHGVMKETRFVSDHGLDQHRYLHLRRVAKKQWQSGKAGKLFFCPVCHYECHADFNASVNVHHSFFREFHWQPWVTKSG